LAEELRRMGDVVVVAMRGQTVSPIDRIDFGAGESRDLAAVAKWVKKRNPKTRVILVGVSLGGAASLMAAGQNPELIDGVITEGAFARLDWAVDEYLSVSLPGGGVIFRPTIWIVQAMTGVRASDVVPMDSTKALANRPCLIVHGEEDRVFSRRHPEALTQNQNCRVWIAPLAGHSQVPRILLQEYVQKIEATVQESSLKRL
jgi:pimeloyl-ACP methyl ester carboxylesterase